MSGTQDVLADFVGGDAAGARSLRRALEALQGSPDLTPALRVQVGAVLAGRMSMRDLALEPELREIADRGIVQLREELDDLSPEDRAELVRRSTALAVDDDPGQRCPSAREPADP